MKKQKTRKKKNKHANRPCVTDYSARFSGYKLNGSSTENGFENWFGKNNFLLLITILCLHPVGYVKQNEEHEKETT